MANGFTPEERLEGLHFEIADWRGGNKFVKVSFPSIGTIQKITNVFFLRTLFFCILTCKLHT